MVECLRARVSILIYIYNNVEHIYSRKLGKELCLKYSLSNQPINQSIQSAYKLIYQISYRSTYKSANRLGQLYNKYSIQHFCTRFAPLKVIFFSIFLFIYQKVLMYFRFLIIRFLFSFLVSSTVR